MNATTSALPPITVIVPCYRAQATLPRAVSSILAGAPGNLQLLLVEDGSPDATGALCDALAAQDGRVTALHRPNGGAGAARNTGLDAATGDWVLFVDADDELLPGLWAALPAALACRPALVLYGMVRASGAAPCPLAPGFHPNTAALGAALEPLLLDSGYLAAPYPKLFCRAALQNTPNGPLRFCESLKVNEDVLFNIQFLYYLQNTSAIYCLPGVYYKQNDLMQGSLSRQLRGDLLDAEEQTRPALAALLQGLPLSADRQAALLQKSRVHAALNQYGLLTGCKGRMPFAARRALFARILAYAPARDALQQRLHSDPNRLLALPYRLGVALRWPGWLAAYTLAKSRFL